MKRHPIAATLILLLLVWSYFARPVYDFAWIAAGRVRDSALERWGAPYQRQDRDALVESTTAQAAQIDRYLLARRAAAADEAQRRLDFSDPAAYARSADALRNELRASLLYPPPGMGAAEIVEETDLGADSVATYRRLRIRVLPGVESIGLYLRPRGVDGPLPLVIAAHGRGGPPERTPDGTLPMMGHGNRDLARGALARGYAVWEPTFVFYAKDAPDDLRERLTVRATEAGTTLPAVEIAKTVGALDALLRRPDLDPARVAMVGVSYGGFYTLYTAALEPRIKAAVVAAYFNDREAVLDGSDPYGFLDWRFPGSLGSLRDPTVAALVCPRPLLVEAGSHDQLFPVAGARRAAGQAAEVYRRLGVEERFKFWEFTGRHDFNGREAWDFLDHWLAVKP